MSSSIVSSSVVQLKTAILMDQITDSVNKHTGLNIRIDYVELANRYIATLNAAETVLTYEGGQTNALWNDHQSISEVASELQLMLWEFAIAPDVSDILINYVVNFLNEVALCVYERSIANQSGMHYSFQIGERLGGSAFTLLETLPGELFMGYTPGQLIKQF